MFYVYKITNLITGKFYVGRGTIRTKTYGPDLDHYYGSGRVITSSIRKYGKENHKKEILETCETSLQVCERESFWIKELDALNPEIAYNLTADSRGFTSESGMEAAIKFYSSLSEEDRQALYEKRATEMRKHIEEIRQSSKDAWAKKTPEEISKVKQRISEGWSQETREAQRQRMTGSKRKGNLGYMVEKYGELEGQKKFEEYLSRHKAACSKSAGKNSSSLKKVYASCPIYSLLNKEVNQPKGAISRRLKNGTISQEDASKRFWEIEGRRGILLQELQEWKNTHE